MVYSQSVQIRNVLLDTCSSVFRNNTQPPIVIFQKGAV